MLCDLCQFCISIRLFSTALKYKIMHLYYRHLFLKVNKPQTNPHTRVFVFLCERHIWYSSPVTKSIKCTCAPPKNLRLQVQQREFKCLIFSPHRRTPSGSHANRFSLQTYLMLHLTTSTYTRKRMHTPTRMSPQHPAC